MGKWISGVLKCSIHFNDVYVEDGQNELSALFPEGWEGEMLDENLTITHEENDEEETE
jgi:hypothetical protein